jgi:uncharacterized protein YggE
MAGVSRLTNKEASMKCLVGFIGALVVVSLCANDPSSKWEDTRQIAVTGSASIDVPTDYIKIKVSVETTDKSHEQAFARNAVKVKKVLSTLAIMGVIQKDISTDYVSLSKKEARRVNDVPVFDGYEASQKITRVVRNMSKYDSVLSAVIGAGVDNLESVTFCVTNEQEKRKEARLLAIRAAKEKAEYMANALGQKVCAPLKIKVNDEYYRSSNANVYNYSESEVESSSLAPSTKTISASVDVVYALCD